MNPKEFLENYLNDLIEKLTREKKNIIIMGDFNFNLMNNDTDETTNEFLETMTSGSLVPLILKPTRITSHSKTLIDNIFTNNLENNIVSGNLTSEISDHLPQFALIKTTQNQKPSTRKLKRDFRNFDREKFILDILEVDWENHINLNNNSTNTATLLLINKVNEILNTHAPLKLSKKKCMPKEALDH